MCQTKNKTTQLTIIEISPATHTCGCHECDCTPYGEVIALDTAAKVPTWYMAKYAVATNLSVGDILRCEFVHNGHVDDLRATDSSVNVGIFDLVQADYLERVLANYPTYHITLGQLGRLEENFWGKRIFKAFRAHEKEHLTFPCQVYVHSSVKDVKYWHVCANAAMLENLEERASNSYYESLCDRYGGYCGGACSEFDCYS